MSLLYNMATNAFADESIGKSAELDMPKQREERRLSIAK